MKNKKPSIKPYFVPVKTKAKNLFKWKSHDAQILGSDSQIYFQKKRVQAPQNWSNTAIDIAASKYFRKSIVAENSIEALVERIALGLAKAAQQSNLFNSPKEISIFIEEIKYILYSQKAAFNSPVWFNLGLKEAYNLKSKSEHFAWDKKKKKISGVDDAYLRPQVSACFIQSVEDNLESIFDLLKSEAKLFKYGSGSGTNFSKLRAKNELLASGGTSSGLISFLEVFDRAAGAIKSGGTTRRAAKMVCLDLDHPEIEDFINWKWREEQKAMALIKSGYSAAIDGEAYRTVSGQNANNSIRVPDRFMKILALNKKWNLKSRVHPKTIKTLSADELWKQICEAAWSCADPGLQFHGTINRFHTCAVSGPIVASNPCSEFMFLDDTACNLASLNLVHFLDDEQNFKYQDFIITAELMLRAQECLVDYSSYPTQAIAQNSHDYRPLGLGFTNLGSFFMRQGIAYDSDEARAWAGFLAALMSGVAYLTSAKMSVTLGAFAGYKKNKKKMLSVLKKHQKSLKDIEWQHLPKELKINVTNIWKQALKLGGQTGFRNAQVTAIAPTGTIGLVMDCDTTGIEPDFSLIKHKKLSGGGNLKILNHSVDAALKKLNYSEQQRLRILEQITSSGSVTTSDLQKKHHPIFACATGDLALSPEAHLKMMSAVQPFISGAISKTVNLPAEAKLEDVSHIYQQAWKLGLKSIAIYRDGSKFVQPLNKGEATSQKDKSAKSIQQGPLCVECGFETILESGCYHCVNCGTTLSCTS